MKEPEEPSPQYHGPRTSLDDFRCTWLSVIFGAMTATALPTVSASEGIVIETFEGKDLGGWVADGDAFYAAPYRPGDSGRFSAFEGSGVGWSGRGGAATTGTLLSPEFEVRRGFINYLVAGARDLPARLGVELVMAGRVVRSASASEAKDPSRALYWRTWDVRELAGRVVRIRVNDQSVMGSIAVDRFVQDDAPKGLPVDSSAPGHESLRPKFHYTALSGWLNDANGMTHYGRRWHLFHQHRPPDSPATVWGHAVSDDLLHWDRMPTAIPCEGNDAIFSGSGLVDWRNVSGLQEGSDPPLLFFYTLHPDVASGRKSTQCMAYSTDGAHTFRKFSGNPILATKDNNDRDPKVFWHEPTRAWFMVLSLSRNNTDREHATYGIFRSPDLRSWRLAQELGPGPWYWECPDMFMLPIDGDPAQMKWVFQKGSGDYIIGSFDGERFTPEVGPIRTHWGGSFYGAQTFSDAPGGRRVQIGWMSTGKEAAPNSWPGMPFNQQMSFPRELTLRPTPEGPRLFREPVAEIARLWVTSRELEPRSLAPGDNALADISGDSFDIECEIELGGAAKIALNLRGEEITYDVGREALRAFGRSVPLKPTAGKFMLRALLDRTSIELFANRGEVTHSGVFFPTPKNRGLSLAVAGGGARLSRLRVSEVASIW